MNKRVNSTLLCVIGFCLAAVVIAMPAAAAGATTLPTISKFAPASGPSGGPVTITGANLLGATSVSFGGTPAQFTVSAHSIIAIVPVGAPTGKIAVTTAAGTGTSVKLFKVLVAKTPTIKKFAPSQLLSGTLVTITGSGFLGASAVSFDHKPAQSFEVVSDKAIHAVVDVGTTAGKVTVTTSGGRAQSAESYTAPVSVWLDDCRQASGHTDVLEGSAFVFRAAWLTTEKKYLGAFLKGTATTVYLNGSTITKASKYWDRVGHAGPQGGWVSYFAFDGGVAPSTEGATTEGGLQVVAVKAFSDGISTYQAGTQLWDGRTCFVRSIPLAEFGTATPSSGPVGQTVTISGENLEYITGVKFGGVTASFTRQSIHQITTHVPRGASTGRIELDEEGLTTVSSPTDYTVDQSPLALDSFAPLAGAVGTTVALHGSGLYRVTAVKFGSADAPSFTAISDATLTVTVPPSAHTSTISIFDGTEQATSASSYSVVLPGGKLDADFGTNGLVDIDLDADRTDGAYAIALDGDGKLLVTGRSELTAAQSGPALVRLEPDGSLDTTFGDHGIVVSDLGSAQYFKAWDVVAQNDGKILVAGTSGFGGPDGGQQFALVRYLHDGTVDTTFGTNGLVTTALYTNYTYGSQCGVIGANVAVEADGGIVLAGRACSDVGLVKYLPSGALDTTFGFDGLLLVDTRPTGATLGVTAVFVRPDGKIMQPAPDRSRRRTSSSPSGCWIPASSIPPSVRAGWRSSRRRRDRPPTPRQSVPEADSSSPAVRTAPMSPSRSPN